MLAAAAALAVPVGWLIGEYLRGFGVPFGARLGIGLLMVPAIFALTLVAASGVWGLRERRRSQAELKAVGGGEPLGADSMKLFERMHELERSSLVRVLGIGAVVETDEITVEFLALELRGGGGVITLRARGSGLASPSMVRWPQVTIADDLGTTYDVVPGGGGGGEESMQYELRFAPSPPAGAPSLDIAVVDFSSTHWPFERADATDSLPETAPWRVRVDLR
jgi:hypothetical protein